MTKLMIAPLSVALLLVLSACNKQEAVSETVAVAPQASAETADEAVASAFDINSLPVSTATLGDFPYISLPAGYKANGQPESKTFARFPFWVQGSEYWVEGKFHLINIHLDSASGAPGYAQLEVERSIEGLVKQMGGVQVGEGKIPAEVSGQWGEEIKLGMMMGLGDVYNQPVKTWVVRRPEGNIWVQLVQDSAQGWLTIGQEKGFEQTAQLLPASALKQQMDADGKVALQVNFATDKTDVLPESLPQIEQVATLLNDNPDLQLAIHGHTDNSGDAAYNQTLSEGRAQAVMKLLLAKGIADSRLSAQGFGDSQPVADNATEAGKAKNRRVELVKR